MLAEFSSYQKLILGYNLLDTSLKANIMVQNGEADNSYLKDIQASIVHARDLTLEILQLVNPRLNDLFAEAIGDNLSADTSLQPVKNLFLTYTAYILVYMQTTLSKLYGCSKPEAELLFGFLDKINDEIPLKHTVMGLVALQCGDSMPLEAYSRSVQAVKNDTDLYKSIYYDNLKPFRPVEQIYTEACPLCQHNGEPFFAAKQFIYFNYESNFEPLKLWLKCPYCSTLFSYNMPRREKEDFAEFDQTHANDPLAPHFSLSFVCDIINSILNFSKKSDTLLDVGIGNGEMLAVGTEMGISCEGIEISIKNAEKISSQLGLPVHCCDFLQYDTTKKYSIITMGDVIEHLDNPLEGLKKAVSLLADDGILWVSTPNYNCASARYEKNQHCMWLVPNHFTYFSFESLMPYLENLGLELLKYTVSPRYNGSMELILRVKKQ